MQLSSLSLKPAETKVVALSQPKFQISSAKKSETKVSFEVTKQNQEKKVENVKEDKAGNESKKEPNFTGVIMPRESRMLGEKGATFAKELTVELS